MEKLWSPWRSKYIESFKKNPIEISCVFCEYNKVEENNDHSLVVFEDKLTFIVLNLYPYNNGHIMVIPKRHLCEFCQLTNDEHLEIMRNINLGIEALKGTILPHGFNVGANLGKAAGAGIDTHLHFHIVPRWNGDTNFMPVLSDTKVISQALLTSKKSLIEKIKEISNC